VTGEGANGTANGDAPKLRLGGMALRNGLLVHGQNHWAAAIRAPNGDIEVASGPRPRWRALDGVPGVRGVTRLGEALVVLPVVKRALPGARLPFESPGVMTVVAGAATTGAVIRRRGRGRLGAEATAAAVGFAPALAALRGGELAAYHGAEHKAIAAYENDVELTPEVAQQFTTAHVRCGTNFLLTVMVVAVVVYSAIPRPNLWFVIGSRIVLMPIIAGLSYEVIRFAAKNMHRRWVRLAVRPGLLLQRLTTREPDLGQLEVAVTSLRAVLTAEQTAEVEARVGRRVPAVAPAF
jgi:uncharacterized protein YqhQ